MTGHTNDSYLQALYPRKRTALTGVARSLTRHMLSAGDLGGDYYTRRDPQRQTKRLVAQLERLGHTVTLQDANAA